MGRDKAELEIGGVPLWQRQLRLLEELEPREIFLSGPARTSGYPAIPDTRENAGPLAGLVASLRHCSHPLLLVLAVDLANMSAEYLRALLAACSGNAGVIPQKTDRFEPLAAVYPRSALTLAEDCLAGADHSLQEFCRRCRAAGLVRPKEIGSEEQALFFNLNTPADLAAREEKCAPFRIVERDRYRGGSVESVPDQIATEEPLEISVEGQSVAVVMRTPGHDRELAAGFLLSENLVHSAAEIFEITQCGEANTENIINVTLTNPSSFDLTRLTRHVFSSSSCGVCSKATLDAVRQNFPAIRSDVRIAGETLLGLPEKLRARQETFDRTGGLHACALFDLEGNFESIREDVGRHNALDKLIGSALLAGQLPLHNRILLLSGRVSFEMMQKALAAGIPIVAAISAPTSLAVDFARGNNQTLIGFLRGETMNIYAGPQRVGRD